MKREFLQNFKIGDQALTKEIIDAIMEENGKDIELAKKPFADYEAVKEQLKTAKEGLEAFKDVDIAELKKQIGRLQGDLAAKDEAHKTEIANMEFQGLLSRTIVDAKGKNAKAIAALLDIDALKASKNQEADIKAALDELKKENDYLFETGKIPPPYAPDTGEDPVPTYQKQTSLAGALREKYAKG